MTSSIIADAARAFPDVMLPYSEEYYTNIIAQCDDIYGGEPPWKYVKKSGLYGKGQRQMNMLGCAKVLCDNLSALTFSGQPDIICTDPSQQKFVLEVLQKNNFWENMPRFLSKAYALGGGVLKVFLEKGYPVVDYVDGSCFIPCGGSGRQIDEGIFRSRLYRRGHCYTLMEYHFMKNGHAAVERALFRSDNGTLERQVSLDECFEGLAEQEEFSEMSAPAFAYFAPAAANNKSGGSLLGLSCFANCTDTLKAIDIAFDSLTREFILGRKRIIVPSSCIRTVVDPDTGRVSRYFDADDEVYQALKCDEEKDLKITDNTAELRVSEHTEAINTLLDILCFQTGLSSGTLSFSGSAGLRTAAEVKSIETRTELTMQANRCIAAELIEKTVRNIILAGMEAGLLERGDAEVRIIFSDRETVDKDTVIDRNVKLVEAGLKSRLSAVMEVLECSEEAAAAELERIRHESGNIISSEK
ncbi:MAG: phage portal protein [Huintestinicola sp.]